MNSLFTLIFRSEIANFGITNKHDDDRIQVKQNINVIKTH